MRGAPVLIDGARSVFSAEALSSDQPVAIRGSERRGRALAEKYLPRLTSNIAAKRNMATLAAEMGSAERLVLVLGSGSGGEGLSELDRDNILLVNTDIAFGPNVVVLVDAHQIPFSDDSFDAVIIQAVLEHVVDPAKVVTEIHRVLKSDGYVYAETPFMQQVHEREYDFCRFTLVGHRNLFRQFTEVRSGIACGPGVALAWAWQYFLFSFTARPYARRIMGIVARLTGFWLKYLDPWLARRDSSIDGASALYFLGRRREEPLTPHDVLLAYRGGMR